MSDPGLQPTVEPAFNREDQPFVSATGGSRYRVGPVTVALIAVCVVVAIYSSLGEDQKSLLPFFISSHPASRASEALPEVRHGEVWRLLTPIFIHLGVMHLIFNMLWMKDLGTEIENRGGSLSFLVLVAVLAVCSDLGQYFVGGSNFGGMSGVVYGLFGYVWLRGRFDPASGYVMPAQTVLVMLAWFVFCMFGILNIANTAHGVGLVVGAAWGYVTARSATGRRGVMVG